MIKKFFSFALIYQLILMPVFQSVFAAEESGKKNVTQYYFQNEAGEVLIPVKILGDTNSGIYHVPTTTDLVTLIAIAGGVNVGNLKSVTINRTSQEKPEIIKVDVRKGLNTVGANNVKLQPNDVLIFEVEKSAINPEYLAIIGAVTATLTVTLLSFVLIDRFAR